MKSLGKTLAFFSVVVMFAACDNQKEENGQASAPEGMVNIDLSKYGKPFSIWVPDTNTVPLNVSENADGALEIIAGEGYGIRVYETKIDLQLKRDDLAYDDVNRFRAFVKEDKDGLIWESAITEPQFHFVLNRNIAGSEYGFEDSPGNTYSKQAAVIMYNAASAATAR